MGREAPLKPYRACLDVALAVPRKTLRCGGLCLDFKECPQSCVAPLERNWCRAKAPLWAEVWKVGSLSLPSQPVGSQPPKCHSNLGLRTVAPESYVQAVMSKTRGPAARPQVLNCCPERKTTETELALWPGQQRLVAEHFPTVSFEACWGLSPFLNLRSSLSSLSPYHGTYQV